MKKTYKIILIAVLFIVLDIFQADCKVYSYTEDEVKEIINYTVLSEKLSEDEYDIKIDATDLITSIKFPVIQASIESVLYDSENLTDINFLTTNSTNENSDWLLIQETVMNFYRVSLYIAAIALITTLIYMAIILIVESYHPPQMPRGARMFRDPKGGNPEREIRKNALFEQWLIAVVLIALITAVINLMVNFSDEITEIIAGYNLDESTYKVYVEGSQSNYTFETTIEGVLMFESEYDWSNYAAKNVMFIIGGIIVTVFKYLVYFIFVIRMLIIAVLVAAAPIVILVNAYLQISRKKGIFRTWFVLFLFCALIKPVIALVYYVMMANDFIIKFPLYILVVVTVEIIAIILLIMMFIRSLRKVTKIEQQEYDEIHGNAEASSTRARMFQHQQGRFNYQSVVDDLRRCAEKTGYNAKEMSDLLTERYQELQNIEPGAKKQYFVDNLGREADLSRKNDNTIIDTLIQKGDWKTQFYNVYK